MSYKEKIEELEKENKKLTELNKILSERIDILQQLNKINFESKELNLEKSIIWIRLSSDAQDSYGSISDFCNKIANHVKNKKILVSGPHIKNIQDLEMSYKERSEELK